MSQLDCDGSKEKQQVVKVHFVLIDLPNILLIIRQTPLTQNWNLIPQAIGQLVYWITTNLLARLIINSINSMYTSDNNFAMSFNGHPFNIQGSNIC